MFLLIILDVLSGHEKVRRLVEILRADVVQGLGVKLLEKVYDVMDEEDEQKREVCLSYCTLGNSLQHWFFLI